MRAHRVLQEVRVRHIVLRGVLNLVGYYSGLIYRAMGACVMTTP